MNLAFVNRMLGISRGGGEIWDLRMAEKFRERGIDVTFYVGKPLYSSLSDPPKGFEYVEVPTPHLREAAYAAPPGVGGILDDVDTQLFQRRVVSKLDSSEYDIVQVCSLPEFATIAGGIDAFTSVVMHGPPHSLWYDVLNPLRSSYDLLDRFDRVVAIGEASKVIAPRINSPVETVNPGVDTRKFTPGNCVESTKHQPTVLFVGRFVPAKNLGLLVDAFAILRERISEARLVLVGDGPQRGTVERKIRSHSLGGSVEIPGYVPNDELPNYYREADVFALSSRSESFGITLLEAMSCGTPIVAPRIGVIPDIVEHECTGLLYERGDEVALANALERVLNGFKRSEFVQAARKRAVHLFDWDQRAESLLSVYSDVVDE